MGKQPLTRTQGKVQGLKGWQISNGYLLQKAVREKLDACHCEFLDAMIDLSRTAVDERIRFAALVHLLDRQLGKAPDHLVVDAKSEVQITAKAVTPEVQAKLTEVITALRDAAPTEHKHV